MYTTIHIRYNVLISGKITIPGNPLVFEMPDIIAFTVYGSMSDNTHMA